MEKTDEKLIEDFLAGDDSAFEKLLKKYLKPVYNFLYQLTKNSAVLDDLTQETFIKAWKHISKFDREKKFKVWIFTIAKNTAYDFLRKKKTTPFSFFQNDDGSNRLEKIDEKKPLPNEILERKDLAKLIGEKLAEIPRKYRSILVLYYKEDFSLLEISEILKRPYNTVKSQHKRALVALKNRFLEK